MAETTTRPSRARKAADKPAAKATPAKAKAAEKAPTVAVGEDGRTRIPVTLEPTGETKSYAVFVPPKTSGCVGKFYAPLGTEEVKVLLIGPAE